MKNKPNFLVLQFCELARGWIHRIRHPYLKLSQLEKFLISAGEAKISIFTNTQSRTQKAAFIRRHEQHSVAGVYVTVVPFLTCFVRVCQIYRVLKLAIHSRHGSHFVFNLVLFLICSLTPWQADN